MKITPFGVGMSVATGLFGFLVLGVGMDWEEQMLRASLFFDQTWKQHELTDYKKARRFVQFSDIQLKRGTESRQEALFEHWEQIRDDELAEYRLDFELLFPEDQPRQDQFEYQIRYGGDVLQEGKSPVVLPGTMVSFSITAPEIGEYEVWQKLATDQEFTKITTISVTEQRGVAALSDQWGSVHQKQFEQVMETLKNINSTLVNTAQQACRVCSTQGVQAPQLSDQNAKCMQAVCGPLK